MFRDPLVLDVLFLLHIGKGLISVVTLSVVVPQAIGFFLRNTRLVMLLEKYCLNV